MAADEHRFCLIIGAGFGGIIQACTFLREGILSSHNIEIIDRYGDFGGVWWKNTYPGAACDIASEVYTISWAPNPCEYNFEDDCPAIRNSAYIWNCVCARLD